jgi:hypothetical protein
MLRTACTVTACAIATVAAASAHDPITTRVTWNGEISRIVRARCVSCHRDDGRGPMPLTSYREARPWAKAIKEEVLTRRMPKWHAVRGYGAFLNDPSLSPFEIALIAAWADGGAPEGAEPAPKGGDPEATAGDERRPRGERDLRISCEDGPMPAGELRALAADLVRGASIALAAALPDGRREPLLWIRDFDPAVRTTYRLRVPLALPEGARLVTNRDGPASGCRLTLTMAPRR